MIALRATLKGLSKLELDSSVLEDDLASNLEVLAEPVQTVMRRYGIEQPYEKLKEMTRGRKIDSDMLAAFIENLAIPEEAKQSLSTLATRDYLGYAEWLAKNHQVYLNV